MLENPRKREELDEEALKAACRAVANNTVWTLKPFDADLISQHANRLFEIALEHLFLIPDDADPNVMTRAIYYLSQAQAIPPLWNSTSWFAESLNCLLMLLFPLSPLSDQAEPFVMDIEQAIARTKKSIRESKRRRK